MVCLEVSQITQEKKYETYMKIRDIFTSKCRSLIGSFMANRIGIFVPMKNNADLSYENAKSLMKTIFTILSTNISFGIRIGVSEIEKDINKTFSAYNNAIAALNKVPPVKGIMFFPELEENNSSTTAIEQIETRLLNRIRLGDAGSVRQLVSLFCQSLSDYYQNDMDKIKNAVFEFLVNMRNSILELDENYSNPAFEAAFSTDSEKSIERKSFISTCPTVFL